MGPSDLLERRARAARRPAPGGRAAAARSLTVLGVVAATLLGGYATLALYGQSKALSVGRVDLSVDPGHRGALDLYVPLVDWGVRFEDAIRLPARLKVDLRTVDRRTVQRVAEGGRLDVRAVRAEAGDAIASYLEALIALTTLAAAALGLLVALAVRHRTGPRLRVLAATAVGTALAVGAALIVLLPPRGAIDRPQYYAFGPDIPRALEAIEAAQRSTRALDQELDAQLVGLARLVTRPSERAPLAGRPQLTLASDLHNNVLALPILERAANGGPLFFAGDLTDRGSPLETRLVRRVVDLGDPFVFVSGNHDSDALKLELVRRGAIVLTERGRLDASGRYEEPIVTVDGLRVAGYSDPFERRSGERFRDRYEPVPSPALQEAFTAWLRPLIGRVDVVMVHEPALIQDALVALREDPPARPIVFLVGHTHAPAVERFPGVTVLNGGSVGAGGTGNLAEPTSIGVARLLYAPPPRFQPLAADLVEIDPGTGSATARRERLDATSARSGARAATPTAARARRSAP
jgi:predicted phosphodiesterase